MTNGQNVGRVMRRWLSALGLALGMLAGWIGPWAQSTATAAWVVAPPVVVASRPVWVAGPVGPVVVPARRVVIHPKVYVRGQPVRNALRAVTP